MSSCECVHAILVVQCRWEFVPLIAVPLFCIKYTRLGRMFSCVGTYSIVCNQAVNLALELNLQGNLFSFW